MTRLKNISETEKISDWYQNRIGKSIVLSVDLPTKSIPGFAERRKMETDLVLKTFGLDDHILSIIRQDGSHITSFPVNRKSVNKLVKNKFWVLRNREL